MAYRDEFREYSRDETTRQSSIPWKPILTVGIPAAVIGAGFMKTSSGGMVWQNYLKYIRGFEEALPMGIGATFRISETVSPLAAPEILELLASDHPELFKSRTWQNYLSIITGKRRSELEKLGVYKGFRWKKTGDVLGALETLSGERVSGNIALMSTGPRRKGHIFEWFARVLGLEHPTFLRGLEETKDYFRPEWLPVGEGGASGRLFGKYLYGVASSLIGRMNLLLSSPFDIEVVEEAVKKVPILRSLKLGVQPGTGLQMLIRYAGKAGAALAAWEGLKAIDYVSREYGPAVGVPLAGALGGAIGLGVGLGRGKGKVFGAIGAGVGLAAGLLTPFRRGPIAGAGGSYAQLQVMRASVSDTLGLSAGARETEDMFPGLTKPTTAVAAAGVGLLLGGAWDWAEKTRIARLLSPGSGSPQTANDVRGAYERADELIKLRRQQDFLRFEQRAAKATGARRLLEQMASRFYGEMKTFKKARGPEFVGRGAGRFAAVGIGAYLATSTLGSFVAGDWKGGLLNAAAGVGAAIAYARKGPMVAGLIAAIPFLLREKEDPEKLKRIYSGEELVEVRKGRAWEMGRTPYEGGRSYYRPHRVAMMQSGTQMTALYGSEENYWETHPLFHPLRFLADPYAREAMMWEQGYRFPVSKTPFEDYPVIGPVLATTIGRILKPPKFVGRDQWLPPSPPAPSPPGYETLSESSPVTRTGLTGTLGEQVYRMTELFGMPGFAIQSIHEAVTGQKSFLPHDQWATPSLVSGNEPAWWSLEMGGLGLLCILEGTPVQTARGIIPIEQVTCYDMVLSRDSRFYQVEAVNRRRAEQVLSVWTACLDVSVRMTPNHVLPVYKFHPCHDRYECRCLPSGNRRCLGCSRKDIPFSTTDIPAQDIRCGDFLEVPLPHDLYGEPVIDLARDGDTYTKGFIYFRGSNDFARAYELIEETLGTITRRELRDVGIEDGAAKEALRSYRHNGTKGVARFPRYVRVTKRLAYALGWYAVEGSIRDTTTQFTMNISEIGQARELEQVLRDELGVRAGLYEYPDTHSLVLHIFSPVFVRLAEVLIGRGSHGKEVEPRLYHASAEVRAAFLRGYMLRDGFINQEKRKAGISTCSRNLAIQSFLIGVSLGMRGHTCLDYVERPSSSYPQGGRRRDTLRHYVVWSKSTVDVLQAFLDGSVDSVVPNAKDRGSFVRDGKLYVQVTQIEELPGVVNVYDLLIDGLHYFTADFVSVHNSEALRRYIPHRRTDIQYVNPLPSGLPSWLPGPQSGYFMDFSRADIYQKIQEPWARLPGAGLAQLYPELKGVEPESYSDFWRYKVLGGVAPWSKEYGQYNQLMSQMIASNRLTAEQMMEVAKIREQVERMKQPMEFTPYRYDSTVERRRVRILQEVGPGKYLTDTFGSAPISLAGLHTNAASIARTLMDRDSSLSASDALRASVGKRAEISDFLRQYIYPGADVDLFIHKDPSLMIQRAEDQTPEIPAVVSVGGVNINRKLVEAGLARSMGTNEALDAKAATGFAQRLFGGFWENLMHGAETPLESFTPLAPVAKFIHQRSALEEFQRSEVYGRDVALWQHPVAHFLAPGISTTAWWAGWRGLPREIREKYMVDEYFDRLEYMKESRLEKAALAKGMGEDAAAFATKASHTLTGVDKHSDWAARLAVPARERAYFDEFVRAPSAAERREISRVVSPQMGEVLHAQWARKAADAAQMRIEAGVPSGGDAEALVDYVRERKLSMMNRNAEIREAMDGVPIPGPNWVGWDKNAEVQDYRVATVLNKDFDTSLYGIWDSDIRRVAGRPWVSPIAQSIAETDRAVTSPPFFRRRYTNLTNRSFRTGMHFQMTSDARGSVNVYAMNQDRVDSYLRDPSIMEFGMGDGR